MQKMLRFLGKTCCLSEHLSGYHVINRSVISDAVLSAEILRVFYLFADFFF